ncbi:WD40-repeat-containing domain protein [Mycena amicta]|nr:WD40-repeat-containing domain protein [Mycena amicta]
MPFFFARKSKSNGYVLYRELRGHSGCIITLRATEDGRFLASAGADGTRVWDLRSMRSLAAPRSSESRGATTALVWIKCEDDLSEVLLSGTQKGYLACWKAGNQNARNFEELYCVRLIEPAEVTGLAFDAPTNRLAVYTLGEDMSLEFVFSIQLESVNGSVKVVPRSIAFGKMQGYGRELMVFDLHGGNIGDVAVDVRKGVLCMDDPSSGTNLYRLEDRSLVKTFSVRVTKKYRPRQVDFSDECRFIISGSDHGVVYIFDRRSGEIVDELRVDPHEWVQTVAAYECAGVCTIFAAKSRDIDGPNNIFVWRKKNKRRLGWVGIVCGLVAFQLCFLVVLAAAGFAYYKSSYDPLYRMYN